MTEVDLLQLADLEHAFIISLDKNKTLLLMEQIIYVLYLTLSVVGLLFQNAFEI